MMNEIFPDDARPIEWVHEDKIKPFTWHKHWIPFTEFGTIECGGQSPIEKYLALTNIQVGVKAVEYFIRTGKLYPGIDWAEQL